MCKQQLPMQHLINELKIPIGKNKVEQLAGIVINENFCVNELVKLSFHKDLQIGFRAAWVLEQVYFNHEAAFLSAAETFLNGLPAQNNHSALRNYVKIMAHMTGKNASPEIKQIIHSYNTDEIVGVVFAWLIADQIPVAVKSHCLNILANLILKHEWIEDELIQTMDFLADKEGIGFFAKVKQIRKQLSAHS
ncbi:hypothetical protein GJU39_03560 [Pedobacter petrophilus]|uniref:HEAT repeat domain-containing protein n=1 Tax=Pedobacter petrophilus TaxID=1908241 RepID=A0A7K0FWN7_9SPHI|nr:hypothetical protein [Pedobacter petrophilus]MRX75156.1 hypothetical protein [Pedobacter petrophilus]